MTRSLATLMLLVPALLAAQEPLPPERYEPPRAATRGWAFGVTGFTGGVWQPSGVDAAMLRPLGAPGGHAVLSFGARLGAFVQDQAVLIGGSQGFFVTGLVGARVVVANLAFVGTERNPSYVRLVAAPEIGVTQGFDSPMPQGGTFGSGALLLGFAFGNDERIDESFALLFGPAVLAGSTTDLHLQVTLRYQGSLGGGGRRRGR